MIGIQIRGVHHLFRKLGDTPKKLIFKDNNNNPLIGEAVVAKINDFPVAYIYNNSFGDDKPFSRNFKNEKARKYIDDLNGKWSGAISICSDTIAYPLMIKSIWLMPDSFFEDYDNFCKENNRQFETVERKYVRRDWPLLKYIYAISDASKNYFFWSINQIFRNNTNLCNVELALIWKNNYPQLSKNLKKGTITGYTTSEQLFSFFKEASSLRSEKRINDVINSFNTTQKKILKAHTLSEKNKETLAKFGKLSNRQKINFIRKMSTVDDANELLQQMAYVVNIHFEWDKNAFIDYVTHTENLHAQIISVKDNIVLVKVNDYDAVKYLGKSTNWCISKNKTYWNQYVEDENNAIQYMIFDFSKPEDDVNSIIGFTSVFNKGITHAHNFVNNDLMKGNPNLREGLSSFLEKYTNNNNIFNILKNDGIKLSEVTSYDNLPYEWNKESFIKYLNECVNEVNYEIVADMDDKLAIVVNDSNIRYFLGKKYTSITNPDVWRREHILFADFGKDQNDSSKLLYGIVNQDDETYESYVGPMYNEHFQRVNVTFDYELAKFNLPYDIICRNDNRVDRLVESFFRLEIPILNNLLEDESLVKKLKEKDIPIDNDDFYDIVNQSILRRFSFDMIKLLYKHDILIGDLVGPKYLNRLFNNIVITLSGLAADNERKLYLPSDNEISDFKNGDSENLSKAEYVGLFIVIKMMMENEKDSYMYHNVLNDMFRTTEFNDLYNYIAIKASSVVKDEYTPDDLHLLLIYGINHNIPEIIDNIKRNNKNKINKIERSCKSIKNELSMKYTF